MRASLAQETATFHFQMTNEVRALHRGRLNSDADLLAHDAMVAQFFTEQLASRFQQQLDGILQVLARLFESLALSVGTRQFFYVGAVPAALRLRHLFENCCKRKF